MIKSEVLFTGYYGQLNTGDDAFVEVAAWGSKKIWNKKNIRFLGVKERLPKILTTIDAYPFSIPKTYSLQQSLLLRNTDYLISAGGSTFQNYIDKNSLKAKAMDLNIKKKLKIGAIGVSIGPFKNLDEEKSNIEYLKRLSFLAVRDKRSYEYAKSLNLPYDPIDAFDLAALLPDIYKDDCVKTTNEKIIGISVCNYESYTNGNVLNEKRRNNELINLIKNLDKKVQATFKFLIINGNPNRGDEKLTMQMIKDINFKNKIIIEHYDSNTQQVWNSISLCDFILTTRLHAGIFACFGNTPFMMVEYHEKCSDFLSDVGQSHNYRLYDAEFDINNIVSEIEKIINYQDYILPESMLKMKEKAYKNFNLIKL